MFNHSATNANKSLEPPLSYPGATPDAERAQKPPLPEPPYKPYAQKLPLPGPPYKPDAKKSALQAWVNVGYVTTFGPSRPSFPYFRTGLLNSV
jgi:hypothetical protein